MRFIGVKAAPNSPYLLILRKYSRFLYLIIMIIDTVAGKSSFKDGCQCSLLVKTGRPEFLQSDKK